MLHVLFAAPQVPWPLDTGGKIRTHYLLRALARRHRVTVVALGDPAADADGLRVLREMGSDCHLVRRPGRVGRLLQLAQGVAGPLPYNIRKYQSIALHRRVLELTRRGAVDLVHCDHIHMAPAGVVSRLPFVVDQHNIETVIWDRFARDREEPVHKRLLFRQQAFWLRRVERALCARAAMVLLCSEVDRQALDDLLDGAGRPEARVVPNGVDLELFSAPGPAEGSDHVFFTGSMDWAPNENAVLTFLDEMWPTVRRRLPGLQLFVVGRNPGTRLQARHGSEGVRITGTVPDVRPFMRGALALVVPMRVGGGTRLKILEAFAARVPVVSTAIGIEGIAAQDGLHYLRAETAGEFAERINRLRSEPALGQALAEAGHALARERYSWDAVGGQLAEEYTRRFAREAGR